MWAMSISREHINSTLTVLHFFKNGYNAIYVFPRDRHRPHCGYGFFRRLEREKLPNLFSNACIGSEQKMEINMSHSYHLRDVRFVFQEECKRVLSCCCITQFYRCRSWLRIVFEDQQNYGRQKDVCL